METLKNIVGECRTYTETACTHEHAYAQLILPLEGTLFIETSLHEFELNDSRLFFLPPDCRHTFFSRNLNKFLVLDVPQHRFIPQEVSLLQAGISPVLDEQWQALRFLMLSEVDHHPASGQSLNDLFHYAYSLLLRDRTPRSIQYLHDHFDEPLELPYLAQLEGYNLTYYCAWFKQHIGLTPNRYAQQLRLNKAKDLLAQTNLSILQIAQQVGYEHHSSLTRLFQQYENLSPLAYRRHSRRSVK